MSSKNSPLLKSFGQVWNTLFTTPVHLDSALAKQPISVKSALAQIVPPLLRAPVTLAEALGVGVTPGEPWSREQIADWRAAPMMAERMSALLTQGGLKLPAQLQDYPLWMTQEWEREWGKKCSADLAEILGAEAPLSIRAAQVVGAKKLLATLKEGARLPVSARLSEFAPFGVRLSGYAAILGSDLYKSGGFEIQDEGSQIMSLFALWPEKWGKLLQSSPGLVRVPAQFSLDVPKSASTLTIVDACAGAGGKSLAMADAIGGKGRVFSYDVSEKKLQALRRRATRAGLRNIQAVALKKGDEQSSLASFKRKADVVLVDAPCSGWGVLRRNPDIKWRQIESSPREMPEIQLRILTLYSQLVEKGGRLVYGVCTFRKDETTGVIERFLAENPRFKAEEGGYFGPGPCDGFFMQSLRCGS